MNEIFYPHFRQKWQERHTTAGQNNTQRSGQVEETLNVIY